uniref:6-phosphogluconate dehydrogenase NADP-binding domain-containing protein n=1 Tax=Lotharella globosa TaxID=91324 RepID=A0A7S3ZHS1_9EUKA
MSTEPKLAFIGAGLMGVPMATRLVNAKYEVAAWNRTKTKLAPLEAKGARVCETAAEAIASAEVTIIMLSASKAIKAVLVDDAKALGAVKGKTIVNMSTIGPDESKAFAAAVAEKGGSYVESPVLGTVPHATNGVLQILASADDEKLVTAILPILKVMGKPRFIGKITSSCTYKLALNSMLVANTTALAYSLGYLRRSGLDTKTFMDIVQGGILQCPYYNLKYKGMMERNFSPTNFATSLMLKDVNLAIEDGKRKGINTNSVEGIQSVLQKAIDIGEGESDFSSLYNAVDPKD